MKKLLRMSFLPNGLSTTGLLKTTSLKVGLRAGLICTGAIASILTLTGSASALPGQSVTEAEAWMQAHPTLRADRRERLSLRRNDTPSRRYTFHGSIYGPGGSAGESLLVRQQANGQLTMVRSEKFTLVDLINGVTVEKLEDALRTLYGAEVYADYRRSQAVLIYSPSRLEDRGTQRATRVQISEGDLYAYIVEVIPNPDGTINTGTVSVMLKEDVPALQTALRERERNRREFKETAPTPAVRQNSSSSEERKPDIRRLLGR